MYCGVNSYLIIQGDGCVYFTNNTAQDGSAISILQSSLTFAENSSVLFTLNTALQCGGGMYLGDQFTLSFIDRSNISYLSNFADQFGGAIYSCMVM